ncbi:Lrp/AsnC family transcriptional regulator [Nonomuraea sp. NPDC052116]|uniref:Lrp/AsnC family transcriptional regulator n=1 Tax=Nonomuraea sp. NPDC052116 TaxID=3155665 RepID=UPI003427DB00
MLNRAAISARFAALSRKRDDHHRAPFRLIGEVVGVSEQTAARRYQSLCRSGVIRVIGLVDPAAYGHARWLTRIHRHPEHVDPLVRSLVQRPDVAYATLTDGLEIVYFISAPLRSSNQQLLPKAAAVREITTNLIIHHFSRTGRNWTAYGEPLTAGQLNLLEPHRHHRVQRQHPGPPPQAGHVAD